ncbi:unnamed protein product [Victoria cruziana]
MKLSLDIILVPPSVGLIIGYHVLLWRILKKQPIGKGVSAVRRRTWALTLTENEYRRGMLGVQSLRNSLMAAILSSTIAILTDVALGAMMNNIYRAHKLLHLSLFGSQGDAIVLLKYSLSSIFLLSSFFCSSSGIGFLTEANFLINVTEGIPARNAHKMLQLGSELAGVGNRVLLAAVPMLLWMAGPVAMAASSLLLVWFFYCRDFRTPADYRSGDVIFNSPYRF